MKQETEDIGAWKKRFAAMSHADLVEEASRWCWSALSQREDRRHILAGTAALLTDRDQRLMRLWALADPAKKSVPMDKFLACFNAKHTGPMALGQDPADGVDPGDELPWMRGKQPEAVQPEGGVL